MKLGYTIRTLRLEKGLNQIEFSKKINIKKELLCKIELGKIKPNKFFITKICDGLGLPKEALYFLSLTEEDIDEDKREFFKLTKGPIKDLILELNKSDGK